MDGTEVISCPACQHLLRVPHDWLGASVQCPECKAQFQAPRREDGRLTKPELISVAPAPIRKRADGTLWIPAFGLMLLGVISLVANSATLAAIVQDPAAYEEQKKVEAQDVFKALGQDPQVVGNAGVTWQTTAAISGWSMFCGVMTLLGGLGILLRRWFWLTRIGSVLAALNLAGCCCIPGAICGLWALLLLRGDEARDHFL